MSSIAALFSLQIDKVLKLPMYQSSLTVSLGVLIVLFALYIRYKATMLFYRHQIHVVQLTAQDHLVTKGVFSISRNPLILAITLIFLGVVLIVGTSFGIAVVFGFQLFWHIWVVKYEEPSLKKQFGKEFDKYMSDTPRWVSLTLGRYFKE